MQREFKPDLISVAKSSIRYSRHESISPHRKVGGMPFWSRRIMIALTSPFGPFPVKADVWININSHSIISLANSIIPRHRYNSRFAGDTRLLNANFALIRKEWNQFCSHSFSTLLQHIESASQLTLGFLRQTWLEKLIGWAYITFQTPFWLVLTDKKFKSHIFYPELERSRFGYSSPAWSQSPFDISFPMSEMASSYRDFKRSIDLYRFSRQIAFSLPLENAYSESQGFGHLNPVMGGQLTPFGAEIPISKDLESLQSYINFRDKVIMI
jgi:hypothetical protein